MGESEKDGEDEGRKAAVVLGGPKSALMGARGRASSHSRLGSV